MASGSQLVSQTPGRRSQTKKTSDGEGQIPDECYISCMILLVLLFSGTSPVHRITAVENEVERSVRTLTATNPKIRRPPLDQAITPMTLVPNFLAQIQPTKAPQRKKEHHKITFRVTQSRLPLVNLVDTSQFLAKIVTLKSRGWPKLKRLGRVIQRNSRRISRLRAHLSFLQAELEEQISRNGSSKAILCRQELTKNDLSPGRIFLIGSLLVQHYLEKCSEGPVDGNWVNIPGLTALLLDQFPFPRA
ncbi:unnamed protein product [Penicillium nalgiovense]|uniref:Uncharacterized protein n=1 Tax=Penicillium nalgiovense TaxID=60175 RepID=A0A9W4HKD4_PENNA|nr:unnamed protein product [Penicillium nalgiovense]CAG7999888.1 unnamed protein product [Penicillium nalgiovense]CAG8011607.1 unnamed protein product [Penicillium nalgiovense]CAG8014416.1 unnamed protein product [Penicillium nalgiovense]CAG8014860.1 unnamed protein product [Penicillium nalgiovense]